MQSSTEAELIPIDDIISRILWAERFIQNQGFEVNAKIVYRDNTSSMKLETNGKESARKRTRQREPSFERESPCDATVQPITIIKALPAKQPPVQRESNQEQIDPSMPSSRISTLPPSATLRRSTRASRPPSRHSFDGSQGKGYLVLGPTLDDFSLEYFANVAQIAAIAESSKVEEPATSLNDSFGTHFAPGSFNNYILTHAFKARATKDPDTFSFDEAMQSPDRALWLEAAKREIDQLTAKGTWVEVSKWEANTKILPGTLLFRKKRNPSGEVKKDKGHYCVRGDLAETEHETFAPVVPWSSVRLFLILTLIFGWHTCSIDFFNAFVQADINEPIWIHLI